MGLVTFTPFGTGVCVLHRGAGQTVYVYGRGLLTKLRFVVYIFGFICGGLLLNGGVPHLTPEVVLFNTGYGVGVTFHIYCSIWFRVGGHFNTQLSFGVGHTLT